jgi:hypothetical protein
LPTSGFVTWTSFDDCVVAATIVAMASKMRHEYTKNRRIETPVCDADCTLHRITPRCLELGTRSNEVQNVSPGTDMRLNLATLTFEVP